MSVGAARRSARHDGVLGYRADDRLPELLELQFAGIVILIDNHRFTRKVFASEQTQRERILNQALYGPAHRTGAISWVVTVSHNRFFRRLGHLELQSAIRQLILDSPQLQVDNH